MSTDPHANGLMDNNRRVHAGVTDGTLPQLPRPAAARPAQAQVPARQQQHARLPLAAHSAHPLPSGGDGFLLPAATSVAAAAARLDVLLLVSGGRDAAAARYALGADMEEYLLKVVSEGIRGGLVSLRQIPPQLILDVEAFNSFLKD
ncbi:BRI1 suppressor 1 (BSU1)-like 2 [Striga asiatica]|uniref:BRI1 suppressor 1 (BSU1)-like 2 n=1 Tax=Striga asiatica TaxID=4170 RepID=A0A5A7Q7W4_STRAF|nr:BRI1 suppressor 1 (BSU1)-like 2 [Striga asiatica]